MRPDCSLVRFNYRSHWSQVARSLEKTPGLQIRQQAFTLTIADTYVLKQAIAF